MRIVQLRYRRTLRNLIPYSFILPAVVALLLFSIYPFLSGIWYSFTSKGFIGDVAPFIGLQNYQRLFVGNVGVAKLFKDAFIRSVLWTVLVVAGQFVVGGEWPCSLTRSFLGEAWSVH